MIKLISQVAGIVGISPQSCRRIAVSAYKRYKIFQIPKRGGGYRVVAQPAREVKAVQRAIVDILAPLLPIHPAAMAYRNGLSIIDNARAHRSAAFLTKLDFSQFFPSIDGQAISHHLRKHLIEITNSEVGFVLDACLWRPHGRQVLCIGAPSSPLLSNFIMYEFDADVAIICAALGVTYTRYSDDISMSSEKAGVLESAEVRVRQRVLANELPTLTFNEKKRVAVGRGTAMRITGLTLSNQGEVTVGRTRKRGVRAGVRKFLSVPFEDVEFERLKGELAFVLDVEPGFANILMRTYGKKVMPLLPSKFAR